jgi:tRNA-uridine 2-sulfurtransferase
MKLIAAMSGGVDSAVAAARAHDAGHEVVGVHLALSSNPAKYRSGARGCCTIEDSHDARRAADMIGIPFYIWDMASEFHAEVVEDFISEYAKGRTPNPCLRCNEKIKFAAVLERAKALGFDGVITGHYAQLSEINGKKVMRRAVDPQKDQSYVLAVLNEAQIQGAHFPLGDSLKTDVRKEAKERGLYVANKPDSHDICFVPSGNNAGWLRDKLGVAQGDIVDEAGLVIGKHDGAFAYTVGQRRGLGLSTPLPSGEPRFVLRIEPKSNTVVVGEKEKLAITKITGERLIWCGPAPAENVYHAGFAQVRAHGAALPGKYMVFQNSEGKTEVNFELDSPLLGLAAGQGLVIYDNDLVVGSATVSATA